MVRFNNGHERGPLEMLLWVGERLREIIVNGDLELLAAKPGRTSNHLGKFVKQISWLRPQSLIQQGWSEAQETEF